LVSVSDELVEYVAAVKSLACFKTVALGVMHAHRCNITVKVSLDMIGFGNGEVEVSFSGTKPILALEESIT
jgi:pseudouridine-5'-phosphate glycosidase